MEMNKPEIIAHNSTLDRLINIHQSIKLEQIKKTNELMLKSQLMQNAQLKALNSQINAANELTRQILRNQINEIEQKEQQRFYKSLSFNMGEAIEKIEKIEDLLLQLYFVKNYYNKIILNLNEALKNLVEIGDKTFVKDSINRLKLLNEKILDYNNEFEKSSLYTIDELVEDLKNRENDIQVKLNSYNINKKVSKIKIKKYDIWRILRWVAILFFGFNTFIFTLFFFMTGFDSLGIKMGLFIISIFLVPLIIAIIKEKSWINKHNEITQKNIQDSNKYEKDKIEEIKFLEKEIEELKSHPANLVLNKIKKDYPKFETLLIEMVELENLEK
jgi:hypothetical protein